jgi:SHS2 domain-containing protein
MAKSSGYEFLDHTADAKFLAYGITLEEAFTNALRALVSIVADEHTLHAEMHREIAIEGSDEKQLLYNFLEEIIFLLDSKSYLAKTVSKIHIRNKTIPDGKRTFVLEATLAGQLIDEHTPTHEHVKAVTYNEMEIRHEPGKITLQVVLDL